MKNIAVITARSGSKGLKDKNIRMLQGIPLIAYSIKVAQESGIFDEVMVSTDSQKYADIAKKYGAQVPFLRSVDSSGDLASSWDTVLEVLSNYRKIGRVFDTICVLQPTSPLRNVEDILGSYKLLQVKNVDAITSVCETEHSPLWCMTLDEDLSLGKFRESRRDCTRQQLPTYYRLNGAIYIRKLEYTNSEIILKNEKELAYIMPRERSVDIDNILDFIYAESVIRLEKLGKECKLE